MKYIYICGTYRSGTTITEKILNNHPEISIFSQPFPLLYIMYKELFNTANKIIQRYPMDHQFLQKNYPKELFSMFLENYIFTDEDLKTFSIRMNDYTGLLTPEILEKITFLKNGNFFSLYKQLFNHLIKIFNKRPVSYIGSKEVLFEEYIPYLLKKGVKVIHVIRDPRDMISSVNFGDRFNLAGMNRPILYSLRNWRKSVAYAIEFQDNQSFISIKYEDLVIETEKVLNKLSQFLGISTFNKEIFSSGIYDQRGQKWMGNSAYYDINGISNKSVGVYKKNLPSNIISFIETVCYPEMKYLEYLKAPLKDQYHESVLKYKDPFENIHKKFEIDYSSNPVRLSQELRRLEILINKNNTIDLKPYFIFDKVYYKLIQNI